MTPIPPSHSSGTDPMTPFAALRASLVFPLGLMLVLGQYSAASGSAAPRTPLAVSSTHAQDASGKALYLEHCKVCHGVGGVPAKLVARRFAKIPDLTDPMFLENRSDDSIVVVLQRGVGRDMKSFTDKLTTDEMRAVAAYVRSLGKGR